MRIDRRTVWTGGTALVCLVLAALGWMLLVSPQRTAASDLVGQRENADSNVTTLSSQIARLKQESLELTEKRTELAAIHKQMPDQVDVSDLLASMVSIAGSSGVTLTSLSPSAPVTVTTADAATGAAATANPYGVQEVTISVTATGEYFETSTFLKRLQTQLPEAFLVDTVSVSGQETTTLALSGRIFTLPATA